MRESINRFGERVVKWVFKKFGAPIMFGLFVWAAYLLIQLDRYRHGG